MEALECIKTRRSIREFTDEPITHALLEEIIDTAKFAPSWKNTQIARYVALTGDAKDKLAEVSFDAWKQNSSIVNSAPMVIVLTYIKNRCGYERDGSFSTSKEDRWQNFDCGIAAEAFCLAAHDKGVASVILGIFDEKKVAEVIGLPEDRGVAAIIPIGYATTSPDAPKRKEVSELVSYLS